VADFIQNFFSFGDFFGDMDDRYFIWIVFALIYIAFLVILIIKKKTLFYQIAFVLFLLYLKILFAVLFLPIPVSVNGLRDFRMRGASPAFNFVPFLDIAKEIREASMGFEITAMKNLRQYHRVYAVRLSFSLSYAVVHKI
jgi:uncharacterized membrane protein YhaH (DUF805 family)